MAWERKLNFDHRLRLCTDSKALPDEKDKALDLLDKLLLCQFTSACYRDFVAGKGEVSAKVGSKF